MTDRNFSVHRLLLACLVAATLLATRSVNAAFIVVQQDGSGDYTTIQAAVGSANKGDIIVIGPGTYVEGPIHLPGWNLTITSIDGADVTIVESATASGAVFVCDGGPAGTTGMSGLTIRGATTTLSGGGLRVQNQSRIVVLDCVFSENTSDQDGGGVWVDNESYAQFTNCVFQYNLANGRGGGVAHDAADGVLFSRCLFQGNTASTVGGGAAIGTTGGLTKDGNTPPVVSNCVFNENSAAQEGGALYIMPSFTGVIHTEATVVNSTVGGNTAASNGGIAVSSVLIPSWSGGLLVNNSVVFNNDGDVVVYNFDNGRPRSLPTYSFSCGDQMSALDLADLTNTKIAPRFRDRSGPDLRLMPGSPCLDSGSNALTDSAVDFNGDSRILDDPMTAPAVATVDMGAFEFDASEFGSLGLAFWIDETGTETPFLHDGNWFSALVPDNGVPAYLDDASGALNSPFLSGSTVIGELNVSNGSFYLANDPAEVGNAQLQLATSSGGFADLNIAPWTTSIASVLELDGVDVQCDSVVVGPGELQITSSSVSIDGEFVIDHENAVVSGLDGVLLDGTSEESSLFVSNLGTIVPGGPFQVMGSYVQHGTRLDGSQATGSLGMSLATGDEQLDITGTAELAGGVWFIFDDKNPPAVGAQFTILTAAGGFGETSFDGVMTANSADGRFVVVSYVTNVGGGESAIATVLDAQSLLQDDPNVQAIGVSLSDVLLADIDDDGFDDLVLSIDLGAGVNGAVVVLLNGGVAGGAWVGFEAYAGAFSIGVGEQPRGLDVGFVDGDSLFDLVVACYEDGKAWVLLNTSASTSNLLTVSTQLVADPDLPPAQSAGPLDVWVGNLDEDPANRSDILITNELDGSVVAYTNLTAFQSVSFGFPEKSMPPNSIVNFKPGHGGGGRDEGPLGNNGGGGGSNDDGVESGSAGVGLGPGIQMSWEHYDTGAGPNDIDSGDFNGDGLIDFVTANDDDASISILLGGLSTTYLPATSFSLGVGFLGAESIAAGDFDGDGDLDLTVACTNAFREKVTIVLRNTLDPPSGSFGFVVEPDQGFAGLGPWLVRASDLDNDGDDDIVALTASSSFKGEDVEGFASVSVAEVSCTGDLDGDGVVSGADLALVLGGWNSGDATADLDGDGTVSGADLAILLGAWGACPDGLID